jgi:glycosyltransferase involved in cell wall biosynthesis
VLFHGRVEREKGVFDLLLAFERVAAARPGLRLEFVGGGAALDALRAAAARSPFADRIAVAGPSPAAPLVERLRRAALCVCPTRPEFHEGLTRSAIEAALAGAPTVISSAVPVLPEMADAFAVYPAGDVEALAATMAALLDAPERRASMARLNAAVVAPFFDRRNGYAERLRAALST